MPAGHKEISANIITALPPTGSEAHLEAAGN